MKRTLVSAVAAATLLWPTVARADCCDSAAPTAGTFTTSAAEAFLALDRVGLETDAPATHHGAVARLRPDGTAEIRPVLAADSFEQAGLPGVDGAAVAWAETAGTGATQVRLKTNLFGGAGSIVVGAAGRTLDRVGVVAAPDGSHFVVWRDGTTLRGARVLGTAGSETVGTPVVLAERLGTAPWWRVVPTGDGRATVVFRSDDNVRALVVDPAAVIDPAPSVSLGNLPPSRILDVGADGAGGVAIAFRSIKGATEIVRFVAGSKGPLRVTLAAASARVKASAAVGPGAIAYLAPGRGGRADVVVRALPAAGLPGKPVSVTSTRAAETGVPAVAVDERGRRHVLYLRPPKGSTRSEAFVGRAGGPELRLTATPKATESAGRLAAGPGGVLFAAWSQTTPVSSDTGSYSCTSLQARVVTPAGKLKPVRRLADCAVTSSS